MSKVIGLHFHELKPGVTEEEFEEFVIEEVKHLTFEGCEHYSLIADRGQIKRKYLGLLVWESAEARDKYFGSNSGEPPSKEIPEEWKKALQQLATLSTDTFTGYAVIGEQK